MVGAGTVVLAAGAWSGQIAGLPDDVVPPVRPVKGQVLRLQVPQAYRPFLTRTVRGTVRGFPVYLVPREDGELVVGATQEELGYDEQVTAGGVYELLRDAHALVPGLTELPLVEVTAELRPGSPDNAPMIGPTRLAGLVLATGHYRNGVLLAPVTADAVAQLLVEGTSPPVSGLVLPIAVRTAGSRKGAGMKVIVNGGPQDLAPGATVEQVVARSTNQTRGVAVAVNDTVVVRGAWSTTVLEASDRVEILVAVQGG